MSGSRFEDGMAPPWGELSGGRTDGPSGYTYGAVAVRGTDQRDRPAVGAAVAAVQRMGGSSRGRLGARCRVQGGRCSGPPPAGTARAGRGARRGARHDGGRRPRAPGPAAGARRLVRSRRGRPLRERSRLRVGRRGRAAVPDRLRARRGLRGCARGAAGRRRARGAARRGARPRQRDRVRAAHGGLRILALPGLARGVGVAAARRPRRPAGRELVRLGAGVPGLPDCSSGGRPRWSAAGAALRRLSPTRRAAPPAPIRGCSDAVQTLFALV